VSRDDRRPSAAAAQPQALANAAEQADRAYAERKRTTSAPIRLASAEEITAESVPPVPVPDVAELSLDQAIETGLSQNPDLVALRQTEGVSEAAYGVASTYPFNPNVQVRATPFQRDPQGGTGAMYHYVLVMQQIQLAHQQQYREEAAASQLNQVRWTICQAELLNIAQTARLYFTALYQRGIRDLTRSNADMNEELLRISERQVADGLITKADVAIVRIDSRSTRQQADLAEANYQTALLDLRRQLNIPLETPISLHEDLSAFHWNSAHAAAVAQVNPEGSPTDLPLGEEKQVIKHVANGRPDLMAAHADIETAFANYRLANAARTPDLLAGPFYQHDDFGVVYFGFQAHMDIPVMNNGKPLVRQRAAEQMQRQVLWEQLVNRAEVDAVNAADRYERARRLVEAARPEFATDLPAELKLLESQFKENEVDVLRIFQGRTSLMQNRRASLDLLNELAQASAVLTAATGIPPAALVNISPATERH
jgi:cobalt-zinc-cadmium efflux system outer membrane protein